MDPCAPRAHLPVMVTTRTHCHFTMQARALRVPEVCDEHTPPSCLVTNSLAELRYRSVNTLALADPSLTQGCPVTFLACALHQLFVRSCDLAHDGLYCSHVCVYTHHSSLQHLPFCVCLRCSSVPMWMNIRTCGCLMASQGGITLTTRAFRTPHHTLSSSHNLMRAPRTLCRYRLHTGVTSCSDSQLCVLPTGHTQCHQSTGSDGPHPHCYK